MNVYSTEEEQVESIKKWWKENGRSVIAGAMIGPGAVFGWRWWVDHTNRVAQDASHAFEQILSRAETGDTAPVLSQAQALESEFGGSSYAAFSALITAELKYAEGNKDGARADLEKVIGAAPDAGIRAIAVLRLARILLDQGNPSAAAALLSSHPPSSSFAGDYAALRGDLAAGEGDTAGARKAYQEALQQNASSAALIQLKLDNLPPAG